MAVHCFGFQMRNRGVLFLLGQSGWFKVSIDRGQHKKGENCRADQSSDDHRGNGLLGLGAGACGDRPWQVSQSRCQSGHQNRPQPGQGAAELGFSDGHALLAELDNVVDQDDAYAATADSLT